MKIVGYAPGKTTTDKPEFLFFCPGCKCAHWFNTFRWKWNGDSNKPSVSPSILMEGGDRRCHSFVKDGMIRFLSDCSHALKGQTVEIPDWDDAVSPNRNSDCSNAS